MASGNHPSSDLTSLQAAGQSDNDEVDEAQTEFTMTGVNAEPLPPTPEDTSGTITDLVSRLKVVFEDMAQYKQLLSCRDRRAQKLLDLFQELLDTAGLETGFRRSLLVATQRLSKASGIFPTCYDLKDVEYEGHPIAAGSFADIYKGSFHGQSVCVKVIRLYQAYPVKYFLKKYAKEALLWGQLAHPNVCPIYGLYRRGSGICLISPWMENGNLNDYLKRYPDANRPLLVRDAAQGLLYLHENDIIHGDLKGANVLVSTSGRACLTDFGLSSISDANILAWTSNSSAESKGGSIRWQAPELFDFETDETIPNTKASDVYAWSSFCYEAFTGAVPFAHLAYDAPVILRVKAGKRPSRPSDDSPSWGAWGLTEHIWSIMKDCWSEDPSTRPTIHQVVRSLDYEPYEDQRYIDDSSSLSTVCFRKGMSTHHEVICVDVLEMLIGIDPVPISESDVDAPAPLQKLEDAERMANSEPTYHDQWKIAGESPGTVEQEAVVENSNLQSLADLALGYYGQGRWEEAEEIQVSVMKDWQRLRGVDDPGTLRIMENLANTYASQRRWKRAENLQVVVMKERERALGLDNPDTLRIIANLTLVYLKQSKWKEAERLGIMLMERWQKILGVYHPDTLRIMGTVAIAYYQQGRLKEAENLQCTVMETQVQMFGADDPDTLRSMAYLSYTYCGQGRWNEAEKLQVVLVEKWKQILGADDPDASHFMENLACIYANQGRWKEAGELEAVVVEERKRKPHDHYTFVSMANLARIHCHEGRWDKAEELQVVVMEEWKKTLGVDHPSTLDVMAHLAFAYHHQGRWSEAARLQVVVMEKWKQMLGMSHPATLKVMADLAATYSQQGLAKEAEKLHSVVKEQTPGVDNPGTLFNLGAPLLKQEQALEESYPLKTTPVSAVENSRPRADHDLDASVKTADPPAECSNRVRAQSSVEVIGKRKRTPAVSDQPDATTKKHRN